MVNQDSEKSASTDNEQFLARVFDAWRAEFRRILEDHRREIQDRLEKIEREIEKKSDKENVDLLVRGVQDELHRHSKSFTDTQRKSKIYKRD